MSKWRSTIARGCAVGMVSTTDSLSEHARVEGGDTVRSGHYPPRFAIAAHRAFRRWIADRAWTSWKALVTGGDVVADSDQTGPHVIFTRPGRDPNAQRNRPNPGETALSSTVLGSGNVSMIALTQSIQNQLQRLLPKSTTRTNVFTNDGGGVRGMLLGANLARGRGVTR
eukprot:3312298-Amphidinium_carterae.1